MDNQELKMELKTLIEQYATNKSELEDYKKICDKENAQIKKAMLDSKLTNIETDNYRCVCSVSKRETMNEEELISLFTSVPGFVQLSSAYGIVKERPYIDFDVLEKVIYDGKMSNEMLMDLDKVKEVKEVVTLRVTKIKQKKEK